jgi:hypothetical protein
MRIKMFDVEAIKARNDLAAQIEKDLGPPLRTSGCRSYWLCPFHDDHHPSLEVNERQKRWYCPPCNLSGDVITWVRSYHSLDFVAACEYLSAEPIVEAPTRNRPHGSDGSAARSAGAPVRPSNKWQDAAWDLVRDCEEVLWSHHGTKARHHLRDRGLANETLRHWHIGFCPRDGVHHGLYVDRGITIPWFVGDVLWKVNVRTDGRGKRKYRAVKGSRLALYGISELTNKPDCVVVEGEFDTLLLWQELGEMIDVLSLGSATGRLHDRWVAALLPIRRFWIATDADAEGEDAARYWLELTGERGKRVLPPASAKDVTEAWQAGADLNGWLRGLLGQQGARPVPVLTPSIDVETRADHLLCSCEETAPAAWASEYAQVADEAGWPCFGMDWKQWAEQVARSSDPTPSMALETEIDSDKSICPCPLSGVDNEQPGAGGPQQDDDRPTEPCRPFGIGEHRRFWRAPEGWVCATCHPPPRPDADVWELPRADSL